MIKPPASTLWRRECNVVGDEEVTFQPRHRDRDTGVELLRMTSLPVVSSHIYPEAPVTTPDGKRFIFARYRPLEEQRHFWVGDLETRQVRQITDEPESGPPLVAPDGKWWWYSVGRTIWRMDPTTFERQAWCSVPGEIRTMGAAMTISSCGTRLAAAASFGPGHYGVVVIDLVTRQSHVAFDHPDCRNAHVQYSRDGGRLLLVQVNDGIEFDETGRFVRLVGEMGASLHVVNDDGSNPVKLNVGSSLTQRVQGHQCWVGGRPRVITTTHQRRAPGEPWSQSVIVDIAAGDARPRIVADGSADDLHFTHMHCTADGRWWISDCNRTARIYVGSMRTGKYKLFCSSGSTFGEAQFTHPHPFFFADGKTIGYNSDVTGVPHVYLVRIPEGFFDDLEQ